MEKYVLICVEEREVGLPSIYNSMDEARHAMCREMSAILDVPEEALYESYLAGEVFDWLPFEDGGNETCVLGDKAWCQSEGRNYDWRIFRLTDENGTPDFFTADSRIPTPEGIEWEQFKQDLFNRGYEAIEDFLGYEIREGEGKDVTDRRLAVAYEQMPQDVYVRFCRKYAII